MPFAFSALNFAHRAFVAFEILALAAVDITRFYLPIRLPLLVTPPPSIFIAARTVSACFCNFASSRFKAAKMSMNPPRPVSSHVQDLVLSRLTSFFATSNTTATFAKPLSYSVGMEYVVVNGQLAIDKGQQTGAMAGRKVIRANH